MAMLNNQMVQYIAPFKLSSQETTAEFHCFRSAPMTLVEHDAEWCRNRMGTRWGRPYGHVDSVQYIVHLMKNFKTWLQSDYQMIVIITISVIIWLSVIITVIIQSSSMISYHIITYDCYLMTVCQIWVCLKIGYIPNYSHLIGIMIINHWVYGYTTFSDKPISLIFFSLPFCGAKAKTPRLWHIWVRRKLWKKDLTSSGLTIPFHGLRLAQFGFLWNFQVPVHILLPSGNLT